MDRALAVTPDSIETRTIHKVRIRIIPLLFLLYIVAYLDRINVGFAALTMNKELAITSQQFGLLVGVFFFGYFLCEIPSNLLLHKIGARIWIARILISWGVIAALTGVVHSVSQLYVARFLLGVMEAGFFPGIVLYLTYWFRQCEQARTIALFTAALPMYSGRTAFGAHSGSCALARSEQLVVAANFGRVACHRLRSPHLLIATQPSDRSQNFLQARKRTGSRRRWRAKMRRSEESTKSLRCEPWWMRGYGTWQQSVSRWQTVYMP